MSTTPRDGDRLQADLAQLRAALRVVEAPPPDETLLRAQFRATAELRARASEAATGGRSSWRLHLAAAAVVVLAVGAALTAVMVRVERPAPAPLAAETPASAPVGVSALQPLLNSPGLSPASAYSVVRVRIPLSAFAVVPGTEQEGTIEADLLVGEDGLARAIRINEADALRVSVAAE
jgi:hypothetical protein